MKKIRLLKILRNSVIVVIVLYYLIFMFNAAKYLTETDQNPYVKEYLLDPEEYEESDKEMNDLFYQFIIVSIFCALFCLILNPIIKYEIDKNFINKINKGCWSIIIEKIQFPYKDEEQKDSYYRWVIKDAETGNLISPDFYHSGAKIDFKADTKEEAQEEIKKIIYKPTEKEKILDSEIFKLKKDQNI